MPTQHAKLSPSSATRWIQCPASVGFIAEHPELEKGDSPYAREGTVAHALGEIEVRYAFGQTTAEQYREQYAEWEMEFWAEGYSDDQMVEMTEAVDGYVDLVKERSELYPESDTVVEERMASGVPGVWGTSDIVIYSPRHVEIIDLKYGAGVRVRAAENPQLRLYGLGAYDTYGSLLGDVEVVRVTVYQPRLSHVDTEELHPEALLLWRDEVVMPPAREATQSSSPRFGPSESACRWCPVAGICRARADASLAEDFGADPKELSNGEIAGLLERIPQIRTWATLVEQHALSAAYDRGETIPGYKVVLSGGRRGISDHAEAIQVLIDAGYPAEQVSDIKTKPLGALEKLIGKTDLPGVLGSLLTRTEGKPALVVESDRREAVGPGTTAQSDFA